MRLILKNFRCHENAEYNIDDSGAVLLAGSSGAGKSTILKAIIFALYGRVRKPTTFGTEIKLMKTFSLLVKDTLR